MMNPEFWHTRWERGEIGFHESEANPMMTGNITHLNLKKGHKVLVPLCGKTRDISWLLTQGYRVVGVELSEMAVIELFEELEIKPDVMRTGLLDRYSSESLDVWVGDFFNLEPIALGSVDGIYDRGAFVALPFDTRRRYAAHLAKISQQAKQLLVCYEYDQAVMDGPPFSIASREIHDCYSDCYQLTEVYRERVSGGLKGNAEVEQVVWLLKSPTYSK